VLSIVCCVALFGCSGETAGRLDHPLAGSGSDDAGSSGSGSDAETSCWGDNPDGENMSMMQFVGECSDVDGFGCGGWGPGECEDCPADVQCVGCTPSCCTVDDMAACDGIDDGGTCDCSSCGAGSGSAATVAAARSLTAATGEELVYVAQIVHEVLADGSVRLRGSLLVQGARSYSVVGQPVTITVSAASATGMPLQARVAAAFANISNQLQTRYAAQVAASAGRFTCRALQWVGRNLPRFTLIASIFILFEVSAAAGEYLPRVLIPNTVRLLEGDGGLRSRCGEFSSWYRALYLSANPPLEPGVSCGTCYDRSIGAAPNCSGALDQCTFCSQSGTNPNAMYQDLRRGIDSTNWEFAKDCAGRAGGYFTQANTGEAGLQARVAAGYTRNAVCPY
jgi:hypothetical protein